MNIGESRHARAAGGTGGMGELRNARPAAAKHGIPFSLLKRC